MSSTHPTIAWHYTTGQKFALIAQSGILLPASIGVKPPEKPILWFSINQYWENTANKALADEAGNVRRLSMEETMELAGGLVRFGFPARKFRHGEALRKEARMRVIIWNALASEGITQGAKPAEWCGTVKPLAIGGLGVEVMNTSMQWECVRPVRA